MKNNLIISLLLITILVLGSYTYYLSKEVNKSKTRIEKYAQTSDSLRNIIRAREFYAYCTDDFKD